ncbi:alkaline phosphatase family protein [Candidatus Bipolaricaulota sp. J31]
MKLDLLIVAWDGAPYGPVRRWLEGGVLPNLRGLVGPNGVRPLISTVPPITPTAWASFHLGVNPGKHGIFDFLRYRPGERPHLVSAQDFPFPTFWELLAEEIPAGFLGFPMGFPPRPVKHGFWIPGFLAPSRSPAHPPEAMRLLREKVGTFQFSPPPPRPGSGWIEELKGAIRQRTRAALVLARAYRPRVLGIHYQVTDTVQHSRWGEDAVEEVFAEADRALGKLVEELNPRDVLVISDHGMGPVHWEFHLNTWLWRQGFITLRGGARRWVKRALFASGVSPVRTQRLAEGLARALDRFPPTRDLATFWRGALLGRTLFPSLSDVDWNRTIAYSLGGMGAITVCDEDRKNELIEALHEVRLPDGGPLVTRILPADEIYWGGRTGDAPDLYLFCREEVLISSHYLFLHHRPFSPPSLPAHHREKGILCHRGDPELASEPHIWEIGPAILRRFGIEPPPHMDVGPNPNEMEKPSLTRYL